MLLVGFLYVLFTGTVFLDSSIMRVDPYPLLVAGTRVFFAGLMLLAIHAAQCIFEKRRKSIVVQLRQLNTKLFYTYAFCLYAFAIPGFSYAMKYLDPVKTCFLYVLSPFITALILYFLYDERLSMKKIYGLIIGFIAVIPIILASPAEHLAPVPWHLSLLGYVIFIAAIIAFNYGWILNQKLLKRVEVPSSLITGSALTIGGASTLSLFLLLEGFDFITLELTKRFGWYVIFITLVTAIAYNLYGVLLKRYSATFISFASFSQPAFALLYAAFFLGQPVSITAYIALGILGFALGIFYLEELNG